MTMYGWRVGLYSRDGFASRESAIDAARQWITAHPGQGSWISVYSFQVTP